MHFALESQLSSTEFIDVLRRSTLADRRPVDDQIRISKMLANASIIATARDEKRALVGVARAVSDFAFCTYLSDLAVDRDYQGRGIGRRLIRLVQETGGPGCRLILLAAPGAASYYPHIGMERHDSCWTLAPPIDTDSQTSFTEKPKP